MSNSQSEFEQTLADLKELIANGDPNTWYFSPCGRIVGPVPASLILRLIGPVSYSETPPKQKKAKVESPLAEIIGRRKR